MASAEALRYHNLVRHGDLTSIHTLVSPSKATASAPTSPSKALILDHHKRLSLPSLDGRLPARRVRVKVMREVETLTDVEHNEKSEPPCGTHPTLLWERATFGIKSGTKVGKASIVSFNARR